MANELKFKWSGKEWEVPIENGDTVLSLREKIQAATHVHPKRQKLMGLKAKGGRPAKDDTPAAELVLKPGKALMMMGQPDAVIEAEEKKVEAAPEIADDFDVSEEDTVMLAVKDQPEVQEKLARRIKSVEVKVLNAPRRGKKCLVLDIDYTLFDLNSSAERPEELARPFLHEFLSAAYAAYDIVIWSATSMKWVEVKMRELGVATHADYKIAFMLDHAAMLTVQTERYGVFDCKPLAFIWAKFPEFYGEHNTIMMDDLRRNYVMNPQQGLVIRPYRKAYKNADSDRELLHLKHYLLAIAPCESLSHLSHKHWERYLAQHKADDDSEP